METTTSQDGTTIAYERAGTGPALVLVGGAFEQRAMESDTSFLAHYAPLLQHFTVYHYDRRGRGDSTDTLPFAIEREIEDIATLIDRAGGTAFVSGISSGAALAFEAALALGDRVQKLALYEPPYNDEADARAAWRAYRERLDAALAGRDNDAAVGAFMELLGVPPEGVVGMHDMPMWPQLASVAPTLAYDAAALGEEAAVPAARAAQLRTPTLIMNGSASFPFMHTTAVALAAALPHGEHRVLEGQTHEVNPDALAPALIAFFTPDAR